MSRRQHRPGRHNMFYQAVPNQRLIGVRSPDLQHLDQSSAGTSESGMTETTFDTTSDTAAANILLTNSSGSSITLESVVIKAKPVYQIGGRAGFIHDAFRDDEDIARQGEVVLRASSDNIISASQCEKLAEIAWKHGKVLRHTYTLQLRGTWPELQPGARYQLTLGVAGATESVNVIARCWRVMERVGVSAIDTVAEFYEIEELFKFDSNALARFFATGGIAEGVTIVVGSQFYNQPAMAYCDGVADEVEINAAIDFIAETMGGGVVLLAPGTYNIAARIELKSGVALVGQGFGTIISRGYDTDYAIAAIGGSGTELTGVELRNLAVTQTPDSGTFSLIRFSYSDESVIDNVKTYDSVASGLWVTNSDGVSISDIVAVNCETQGIEVGACTLVNINNVAVFSDGLTSASVTSGLEIDLSASVQISNVEIRGLTSSDTAHGVILNASANIRVSNVNVDSITTTNGANTGRGMWVACEGSSFSSVSVNNVDNSVTAANSEGIVIFGDDNQFTSVYVTGCSGDGIEIKAAADRTMISGGRSTGNGTNYTNSGTNTSVAAFDST